MKTMSVIAAVLALGLAFGGGDAEAAKRLGGGKSTGMQREMNVGPNAAPASVPGAPMATPQAPAKTPLNAAPAAAAQPNKRSWMGPLAGLAAGLGLAALASHFGFGEALASFMTMALLGVLLLAVVGFFLKRRAGAQHAGPTPAWAGATGAGSVPNPPSSPWQATESPMARTSQGSAIGAGVSAGSTAPATSGSGLFASLQPVTAPAPLARALPEGFDAIGFVRVAKTQFIRLQAANDAANLDELRAVTTPEMFAEFKLEVMERAGVAQRTEVVTLEAEVLEVVEDASRHIASVRFRGTLREDQGLPEAFDEVWHLTKFRTGHDGWLLSGIQQLS